MYKEERLENLYFIAVVPPQDIRDEVLEIKKKICLDYESNHALNAPAHITLHMPFRMKERKKPILIETLNQNLREVKSFDVLLKGFGCFAPRVIYVNVLAEERLTILQKRVAQSMKQMNVFNADYKDRGFHPHITVAFRDLKKPKFHAAWKAYEEKKFSTSFQVKNVTLLKFAEKKWSPDEEFLLG